jgi:hypothetical protein
MLADISRVNLQGPLSLRERDRVRGWHQAGTSLLCAALPLTPARPLAAQVAAFGLGRELQEARGTPSRTPRWEREKRHA